MNQEDERTAATLGGCVVRVSVLHQIDGSKIVHVTDILSGCVETSDQLRDVGLARAQALERLAWKVAAWRRARGA